MINASGHPARGLSDGMASSIIAGMSVSPHLSAMCKMSSKSGFVDALAAPYSWE